MIRHVVGFMDVSLSSGLLKGERLMEFFRRNFVDRPIEELAMPFAAVGNFAAHRRRGLAAPGIDA